MSIPAILQRSDYIIGLIAAAIGPNKSKKLTRHIVWAAKGAKRVYKLKRVYNSKRSNTYL